MGTDGVLIASTLAETVRAKVLDSQELYPNCNEWTPYNIVSVLALPQKENMFSHTRRAEQYPAPTPAQSVRPGLN